MILNCFYCIVRNLAKYAPNVQAGDIPTCVLYLYVPDARMRGKVLILLPVFHIFTLKMVDKENSPQKQTGLGNHPTKAASSTFLTAHHGVHCTGCPCTGRPTTGCPCTGCPTTLCSFLATLRRRHCLAQFLQCHPLGTRHARSVRCLAAPPTVPSRRAGCCTYQRRKLKCQNKQRSQQYQQYQQSTKTTIPVVVCTNAFPLLSST